MGRRKRRGPYLANVTDKTCDRCGGPLRDDARYGICLRNQECRRAHNRERNHVRWESNPEYRRREGLKRDIRKYARLVADAA